MPDVAVILSALLYGLLAFVVAVKAKKSAMAHEGHYCALIHDQSTDVAFGG